MKVAYVTTYDSRSLKDYGWSGTGYHIAQSLEKQDLSLEYIGPLSDFVALQAARKIKSRFYKAFYAKNYQKDADPATLKNYARQIARKLTHSKSDIVFSATVTPISYLDCEQPIVFWADATFANIHNFYPWYSNLPQEVIRDWHHMEQLALEKCKLAIYSSDWAAKSAINDYGADPAKVKVISFGSNTEGSVTSDSIQAVVDSRPSDHCNLLFLGVDWVRKGGDVAYQVAKKLNQAGLTTKLTIVGCEPLVEETLPGFVECLGFISKSTEAGKAKIQKLLMESHFLILPTLADCTPIVFCEANSLGVPCLSTTVGGVPTIIYDDVNGCLLYTSDAADE